MQTGTVVPIGTEALAYAGRGWRVFPLDLKRPRVKDWPTRATTDARQVCEWWSWWPNAGIGLATGRASGVVVVDVDSHHGGDDALWELEASYSDLPATVESHTGGGGRHLFFAAPIHPLQSSAGRVGHGIDVRAEGGQVVLPPSPHESGKSYTWSVDGHPDDQALAELPEWLYALASRATARTRTTADIEAGERHTELVRMAGSMVRAGFDLTAIRAALHAHNTERCKPPLPTAEVDEITENAATFDPAPPWSNVAEFVADERLSRNARFVLMVLAARANAKGEAWPSYEYIRRITRLSRTPIASAIRELEAADRLQVERRCKASNLYKIKE